MPENNSLLLLSESLPKPCPVLPEFQLSPAEIPILQNTTYSIQSQYKNN